jgi:hypothetical protein
MGHFYIDILMQCHCIIMTFVKLTYILVTFCQNDISLKMTFGYGGHFYIDILMQWHYSIMTFVKLTYILVTFGQNDIL